MGLRSLSLLTFALVLLFVSQTTACSYITPDYYYIDSIYTSNDPDILIVNVKGDPNINSQALAFSISGKSLSSNFEGIHATFNDQYASSIYSIMSLKENTTGMYLSYSDSDSDLNLSYLFDVTAFAINNESLFKGIIYEKLDRMYIYESIDMYDNSNLQSDNTKLIGSLSSQQIIQNGSNLFPNRLIAINLDLDVGEVSSRYGSANCGGPSYYRISESGFEFIVETTDADRILYDIAADKIHILSQGTRYSIIYSFGAHSKSSSTFTVTANKLQSILNKDEIDSTESETMIISTSLSFIISLGFIMVVRRQKYKKN